MSNSIAEQTEKKKREKWHQQLLETLREGYFETDLNGKLTHFNNYIVEFHGRTPEELSRLSYRDFIPADQAQTMFDAYRSVYQTGRPSPVMVYDVVRRDGTIRTAESVVSLRRDNDGRAVGFCGIARDVTEKKKIEIALRESEESYRRIMELSPEMIVITRVSDGILMSVNDAFSSSTGYRHEEAVGKTTLDLNLYRDPSDRQKVLETLRKKEKIERMQVQIKDRTGAIRDALLSARFIRFKGEKCFLGIFTDISELKKAHRALEERERRHHTILETFPYSVTITRLSDSRYLQVNQGFTQRTGYTAEEVIGKSSLELNIFRNLDERKRLREAILRDGRVDGMEITFQGKGGRVTETIASARRIQFEGEDCLLFISSDVGELKKAQRELAESETSFRAVLDAAPYSIAIARTSDWTYVHVNERFCQRTGYAKEEVIGRTSDELDLYSDPADRQRFIDRYRRDPQIDGVEMTYKSRDGRLLEVLVSARPIRFKGEECLLTITSDIANLKAAQRALQQSEESYRTILQAAPYSITISRIGDGRYLEVNDAFTQRTGYTREEAVGRTSADLKIYKDPDDFMRLRKIVRDHGKVDNLEIQFRTKDGTLTNTLASARPIRYRGENCFLFISTNIDTLKKTQRALEESEARFRAIFETAADPIFLTDTQSGRFIDVNQAACRHLGYDREELLTLSLKDIHDPSSPHPLSDPLEKPSMDAPFFFETIHVLKDGSKAIVEVSSRLMVHQGRQTLLCIIRDVTKRKETETQLKRYQQKLEQMVAERTQALEAAQAELVKREKLAVLGQLTATVSHELRNPLGVIRSSNFYLQHRIKDKDEKIDKHFNRIEDQVATCDAIVADLLEYTRGRHAAIVKEDPTPWLKQVVEQVQEQEDIEISLQLGEKLLPVPHDQEKMRRVIINLLLNAVYAVKTRSENNNRHYQPRVQLKADRQAEHLVFEVTDNGIGMDEETRRRAFEPLFTTRARGTGIGLANVKKIIDEHGGTIDLESRPGEGTRIRLGVPYGSQS